MYKTHDLFGKVIVVTGGSAGLGEQICYEAARQGATVVVCARRINLIDKVKEKCEELSGQIAFSYQLDIADSENVEQIFQKIMNEVGTIDVLVNNAGFGLFEHFIDTDLSIAKKMFEVNILGMMALTQKVALLMAEKKEGHIINIASMAGKIATPKSSVYSATKFAVLGFSNALRLEMKPMGVAVTTVNPGPIQTDFFDKADPSGNYLASVDLFVLRPEWLAKEIVKVMGTFKREINRPRIMESAYRMYTCFPRLGDFLASGLLNRK